MSGLGLGEIRALFAQEAEVRLAHLDQLLLQLEQSGGDETLIRSVFRELHTLKGSSAVAGLTEISAVAHELEEIVEELRSGHKVVTPEVIDLLLAGADRLGTAIAAPPRALGVVPPPLLLPVSPAERDPAALAAETPGTVKHSRQVIHGAEPGAVVMVPLERLDEMVRLIGESASAHLRLGRMLLEKLGVDPTLTSEFNDLSRTLNELQDRAMRTRMVPLATVTDRLQRAVRDLARSEGKPVRWDVRGADTELDRGVLGALSETLLHLVRNAVDHGIESAEVRRARGKEPEGTITLHAMQLGSEVIIAVSDDGGGINTGRVREEAERRGLETGGMDEDELTDLIFHAGLSTTAFVSDVSGRGVGLDVVRTSVEAAHGRVEVRSRQGRGTEFRVIVPITLAVMRCLLVESGGQTFALPFHRVVLSQGYDAGKKSSSEGRAVVLLEGQPVPVTALSDALGLPSAAPCVGPVVVLADTNRRHGFQVDRLVGQRDVVVKGLSGLVSHLPAIAGASVEPDNSVLLVLDPPGLIQRARASGRRRHPDAAPGAVPSSATPVSAQRILVVDDALTIRELQRSILERAGFVVRVAVDGVDALSQLAEEACELILTDIEMPNMDGFALTQAVRSRASLANIPVLILSSRASDADHLRGLEAGADGYIQKSGFDEGSLLMAVNRLIGGRR